MPIDPLLPRRVVPVPPPPPRPRYRGWSSPVTAIATGARVSSGVPAGRGTAASPGMAGFAPGRAVPLAGTAPASPLLSHAGSRAGVAGAGVMCAGVVLSHRAGWDRCKHCVTPRSARGASVPGAGVGGPSAPTRTCIRAWGGGGGVFHKRFPVSTCLRPVPGGGHGGPGVGSGGPWWERGGCLQPRNLFPSTCLGGSS